MDRTKTIVWAEAELAKNKTKYDMPLIAAYGYYKILASTKNKEELIKGIELVELTSPYFFNENLQLLLAKTYISLDKNEKARSILNDLTAKNLLKEQAEKLLKTIS